MQDSELLVQTHLYLSIVKYAVVLLPLFAIVLLPLHHDVTFCGVQIVGRKLVERHTKKNITISPHVVFALCHPCHLICSLQTECLEQVSFGELDYNSRCPR